MRPVRVWLSGLVVGLCLSLTAAAAASAAPTCTDSWTNASGGAWGTGTNWSTGAPPATGDVACITLPGTYTVTLSPYVPPVVNGRIGDGDEISDLVLGGTSGTQTLDISGQSFVNSNNQMQNDTTLTVDKTTTIAGTGHLVLDATNTGNAPRSSGESIGGEAVLNGGTLTNAGTISAQTESSMWTPYLGGAITNNGTIATTTGTLHLPTPNNSGIGYQNSFALTNSAQGTIKTAAGSTINIQVPGTGAQPSQLTNNGTVTNSGAIVASSNGGGFTWAQSGGSVSGNPIELQLGSVLADSAGTGSFLYDNGSGGLQGTIPAGQSVTFQASSTVSSSNETNNDATLDLGKGTVTNNGSLTIDASSHGVVAGAAGPGNEPGAVADITDGTLDNAGTLTFQIDNSNVFVRSTATIVNQPGGTTDEGSGITYDFATMTNHGTWNLAPGASLEPGSGSTFTNAADGTFSPEIASASSFGSTLLGTGCCSGGSSFDAGGTLAPVLSAGFTPSSGEEFQLFSLTGGAFNGTFAKVTGPFSADYAHESASPAYVGVTYGAASSGSGGSTSGGGSRLPAVVSIHGGSDKVTVVLSCSAGTGACTTATLKVSVRERVRGRRVVAVSARAKGRPATVSRTLVLATATAALAAGAKRTVTLTLDRTGAALVKAHHGRLKVELTVTAGSVSLAHAVVRVTAPVNRKATHRKKRR